MNVREIEVEEAWALYLIGYFLDNSCNIDTVLRAQNN
jgi:hypothetical protein